MFSDVTDEMIAAADKARQEISNQTKGSKENVLRLVPKGTAESPAITPVADFLADLQAAIARGDVQPTGFITHYISKDGTHAYWRWNLSQLDHLGLLVFAQMDIVRQEQER